MQAHFIIEPVGCTLLEWAAVAPFGVVEIDFIATAEFLVRVEVEPVGVAVSGVSAAAAPDKRASAETEPGIVEYVFIIVNESAVQ